MFGNKTEERDFQKIETVFGPSVVIKGNLTNKGDILIEGAFEGHIKSGGTIVVGNEAKITADMEAKSAEISGQVKGNIKLSGFIKINSNAKITGDINCVSMSVEDGAMINGKFNMNSNQETKEIKPAPKKEMEEEK